MQAFKNPFQNAESFLIVLSSLNQDHLEAGPVRRSTVTKVVHDAHQVSASLAKIVSISALPFYLRCFPYGGPRSEKRWVTSGLSPFKPDYCSDVSCLGSVAGRWSRGCSWCYLCSGAPWVQHPATFTFNEIPKHFQYNSQPLSIQFPNTVSYFQFKKPRFPDEVDAGLLYAEHMIEVG